MANPEHIEWLKQGVKAWNERRKTGDFRPDLGGADLGGEVLLGAVLERAVLRRADLERADLREAVLLGADLGGAVLRGANLWGADLRAADLAGADLRGADLGGADVRSVLAAPGINNGGGAAKTDLSTAFGLSQDQLDSMIGDSGTLIPDHLKRPAHWEVLEENPVAGTPKRPEPSEQSADNETSATRDKPDLRLVVRKRSVGELRAALLRDYPDAKSLTEYMVSRLQRDIAAHEMSPKPNGLDALNAWTEEGNSLREMLAALTLLNNEMPQEAAPDLSDSSVASMKERLKELAGKLNALIQSLDEKDGSISNAWKVGQIGLFAPLLALFGIPISIAAPIAAGVVGVTTLKVILGKR